MKCANGKCPADAVPGRKKCPAHAAKAIVHSTAWRAKVRREGRCQSFGSVPARPGFKYCQSCSSRINEGHRVKRARLREAGLCVACRAPAVVGRGGRCARHADEDVARSAPCREGGRVPKIQLPEEQPGP